MQNQRNLDVTLLHGSVRYNSYNNRYMMDLLLDR